MYDTYYYQAALLILYGSMLLTSQMGEVCVILVGVRGLEPPTSASRTLRASRLRYTPVLTIHASDSLALSSEPS